MPTLGLDLGGTKLLAGVVEGDGTVLVRDRRRIAGLPLGELLDLVVDVVAGLGDGLQVGVGVPALLDRRTGVAVYCNHLPFGGVAVADVLGERLARPVVVDNDATCAVLAEWRLGAARGRDHVALLTLGTGIGGGLVLDGRVYRGAVGAAAELGHMPVDLDGPPCFGGCPGRGCLEALCSGSALARDAAALLGRPTTGEEITELARAGDAVAVNLMQTLGDRLGAGLAGIAMALNPEVIVLGGGVMAAGSLVLEPARQELRRRALAPSRDVPVVAAQLGEEAGMIGAAFLAA
ncbi:MAG: glucokinase [Solirubrobacteraceae bacterium]|jgi:glucokinase|nr:glucokinase [Solirubrobacteraceae bacterium]